jgi:hypothetical protein
MSTIPNINVSTDLIRTTLGATTNDFDSLFVHPNINMWSAKKPWNRTLPNSSSMTITNQLLAYLKPTQDFNTVDFEYYNHLALAPDSMSEPNYNDNVGLLYDRNNANNGLSSRIFTLPEFEIRDITGIDRITVRTLYTGLTTLVRSTIIQNHHSLNRRIDADFLFYQNLPHNQIQFPSTEAWLGNASNLYRCKYPDNYWWNISPVQVDNVGTRRVYLRQTYDDMILAVSTYPETVTVGFQNVQWRTRATFYQGNGVTFLSGTIKLRGRATSVLVNGNTSNWIELGSYTINTGGITDVIFDLHSDWGVYTSGTGGSYGYWTLRDNVELQFYRQTTL